VSPGLSGAGHTGQSVFMKTHHVVRTHVTTREPERRRELSGGALSCCSDVSSDDHNLMSITLPFRKPIHGQTACMPDWQVRADSTLEGVLGRSTFDREHKLSTLKRLLSIPRFPPARADLRAPGLDVLQPGVSRGIGQDIHQPLWEVRASAVVRVTSSQSASRLLQVSHCLSIRP
jgi:hypothetical protein